MSLAVYVTVVVPIGKLSPGLCELVRSCMPQLSIAVGGAQFTFELQVASARAEMSVGHPLKTGGVSSVTIILNLQEDLLPLTSRAVYVTSVLPIGKESPE